MTPVSGKYHRVERIEFLKKALEKIASAKSHTGGSEAEPYRLDFDKVYNSDRQQNCYGKRTRKSISEFAEKEIEEAHRYFRSACKNCELRNICCDHLAGDIVAIKKAREQIFDGIYNSKEERKRIRDRIEQTNLRTGEFTALCEILTLSGRLNLKKDYIK